MRPAPHPRLQLTNVFAKLRKPAPKPPPAPPGLGTWIARLAKPIARLSDRHFGTKLTGCAACAQRQTKLDIWTQRWR